MPPIVSIIIPVFNSEKYLRRCFTSILSESISNIEIIVIDDGSTDNSLKICKEVAQKHNNLHVVSQTNQGQGEARNQGLELAKGEFIWFVDSDDYVSITAVSEVTHLLQNIDGKTDGIIFTCLVKEPNLSNEKDDHPNSCITEDVIAQQYNAQEVLKLLLNSKIVPLCCNKIFRRSLFKDFRFVAGIFFEDVPFNLHLIASCNNIQIIKKDFYVYDQHDQSTMNSNCTNKHINSIFVSLKHSLQIFNEMNLHEENQREIVKFLWYQLTFLYLKFVHNSDSEKTGLFLDQLSELTLNMDEHFFTPVDDNFLFGTLIGSLTSRDDLTDQQEKVFASFNFPESFVEKYM